MNSTERHIWVDGRVIPDRTPVLMAESRSVFYGAGCFETFRSLRGRILRLDRHLARLDRGLNWLGVPLKSRPEPQRIRRAIGKILEKNDLTDRLAMIRIQASLTGGRGYGQVEGVPVQLIVTADPLAGNGTSCRLIMANTRVVPAECRPADLKLSNTLHYMDAWRQAERSGFDDAIMMTTDGYLAETSTANLFWKKGGVVATPSTDCDILPGVMREVVLELLSGFGKVDVQPGHYRPGELEEADLVWITNSLKQVVPVSAVGERSIPAESELYTYLHEMLNAAAREDLS